MVRMKLCLMLAVSMNACGDTILVVSLILSPLLILGFPKFSCSKSLYLAAFKAIMFCSGALTVGVVVRYVGGKTSIIFLLNIHPLVDLCFRELTFRSVSLVI